MSLLDSMVGTAFRDEKVGRVVVFSGDRRNRGYIVRSPADELKIKSFLKMFYFAYFSIVLLGMPLANACATFFMNIHAFGEPAEHLFRSMSMPLGFTDCWSARHTFCFGNPTRRHSPVLLRLKMKFYYQGIMSGENLGTLLLGWSH